MQAFLVGLILRLCALLPLVISHGIGAGIGWLAFRLPIHMRRVTVVNLEHCLPDWSNDRRNRLALQSLMETGKTLMEMGTLWFRSPKRVRGLFRSISGQAEFDSAFAQDKGVIILTPHLGAWEITPHFFELPEYPLTCLYRPPRQKSLENMVHSARQRAGVKLVPTSVKGVRELYVALARKELIGILPDQDPGRGGGVFAPFFGISARTMLLVNRLARKTGAPVLILYAKRLPWGRGYALHIRSTPTEISDSDPIRAATALNQAVERCVLEIPEQYQWSYKRFKARPEGEKGFYS